MTAACAEIGSAHSFVESPDMISVYNGIITTDAHDEAIMQLPAYFDALSRDPLLRRCAGIPEGERQQLRDPN